MGQDQRIGLQSGADTVNDDCVQEYIAEPLSKYFDAAIKECEWASTHSGLAGISTGFKTLDSMTSGMRPGQLWTIGGATGSGKSALALCIARNVVNDMSADQAPDVYFASLEMGCTDLIHRLAAIKTGFNLLQIISWDLNTAQKVAHIDAMNWEKVGATYIHTDDRSRLTIEDIRKQLSRLDSGGRLGFAVVDYLQLVTPSVRQGMREREVAEAIRGLKELARCFKIPIIGCSQLSRKTDGSDEPELGHLRESGEIEHASDIVILIGRSENGVAHLNLAKGRNCKKGKFELAWSPECTRFADLSRREEQAAPPVRQGWTGYE
jgi:replicative DNA helicase